MKTKKLGISWPTMKLRKKIAYKGTPNGVKQSVSRANRNYGPLGLAFEWGREKDNTFYVRRVA